MSLRIALTSALLAACACMASAPAIAAPATAAELQSLQPLFGWDKLPALIADGELASHEGYGSGPRHDCARPILMQTYTRTLDESFRQWNIEQEDVAAWQEFAATAGGAHFLQLLREQLFDLAQNGVKMDGEKLMAALSAEERTQVRAFLQSSTGVKSIPRMSFSQADAAALDTLVKSKCDKLPTPTKR